jgi:hypothetical protein
LPKSGGRGVIALLPLVPTALFLSVGLPVFITQSSSSFMHIMLAFFFQKLVIGIFHIMQMLSENNFLE